MSLLPWRNPKRFGTKVPVPPGPDPVAITEIVGVRLDTLRSLLKSKNSSTLIIHRNACAVIDDPAEPCSCTPFELRRGARA